MNIDLICPCGRNNKFNACCGRIHANISLAITAEDLMRSRYSAFVLGNVDYLSISHALKTRKTFNPNKTKIWTNSVHWQNLVVLNTSKGLASDIDGIVEFKAFFIENGVLECIHGNSRFIRDENNLWMYLDELI